MIRIFILIFTLTFFSNSNAAFTDHFKNWLKKNHSSLLNKKASFGGKLKATDKIKGYPIILVHGNSDVAITKNFPQKSDKFGWNNLIFALKKKGISSSSVYAYTWGNGNPKHAQYNYHSYKNLNDLRSFIIAVKKYTGAKKVNIVSHSMGVTLSRGAIIGGKGIDFALLQKNYNLGKPLDFINKFIGISGANLGLKSCYLTSFYPVCAKSNGFFPFSNYLRKLNSYDDKIAQEVYSICSMGDKLLGDKLEVLGKNTCFIKNQDGKILFTKLKLNHFETKTKTSLDILNLLK